MKLFLLFFLVACLATIATIILKKIALFAQIIDIPDRTRKLHKQATPLLGGVAIFISFFTGLGVMEETILARGLTGAQLFSFFIAGLILIIGGVIDDIYELSPQKNIVLPVVATIILIAGGVGISKITNPGGGLFYFSGQTAAVLTFIWVMGMIYTTKLLDGVDGLVAGLGTIAGLIIFLFAMTTRYYQPDVGLMALIFAAACAGFLIFNFYPAKIFLGESGSLFVGYVIAVLAIISGAKIAVALLIMGLPVLDAAWTILRRLRAGNNPFKSADKKHLHHRFLDMGFSQRQTVLVYYSFAAAFGGLALFLQSNGKIIALGVLTASMAIMTFFLVFLPVSRKN